MPTKEPKSNRATRRAQKVSQEDESSLDDDHDDRYDDHDPVLFSGDLPGPTGIVPTKLHELELKTQRKQASELYKFFNTENQSLLELNSDINPRVALINIPQTSKVRVIYGTGFGSKGIGQSNAISGKFVTLHGDAGNELGPPSTLVLPASILAAHTVTIMSHAQFCTEIISKGPTYTFPLLQRNKVAEEVPILQVAPIPAYLVYDGFHQDLDAADVYERLLAIDAADEDLYMYRHAQHFLLSCLSTHNSGDAKPYVSPPTIMAPIPQVAKEWAKDRFRAIFPTLVTPAGHPPTTSSDPNLAKILEAILPHVHASASHPASQDANKSTDDKTAPDIGMSKQELAVTLEMCGLPATASHSDLPEWFIKCSEKGNSEQFKMQIIRKHIMNNAKYEDAEVPLTSVLLKLVLKRNWIGKDGNIKRPSLIHAADGLSPFLVLDLDEDEVAKINDDSEALLQASSITMDDIRKLKVKFKPKVPESSTDFMLLLKRFANLLFALFSATCPYFRCVVKIIEALKEFSKSARDSMSQRTKASILWIVLLQGRQFAMGEMAVLAEFTLLHTNLQSKQASISHAELPVGLFEQTKKRTNEDNSTQADPKKPKSETREKNPNNWNPKLKAKLAQPLATAGYPSFSKIIKYCDCDAEKIFPRDGAICTPNAFFGRCFNREKCTKKHTQATDEQADLIITLVKKFIDNPKGITAGQ